METSTEGPAETATEAPVEPAGPGAAQATPQPETPTATRGTTEGPVTPRPDAIGGPDSADAGAAEPGTTAPEAVEAPLTTGPDTTAEPGTPAPEVVAAPSAAEPRAVGEPTAATPETAGEQFAALPETIDGPAAAPAGVGGQHAAGPETLEESPAAELGAIEEPAAATPLTVPEPAATAPGTVEEPPPPGPAQAGGAVVVDVSLAPGGRGSGGGAVAPASLSPSRAGDFMQCPLLYRFRVIDRLPEKPSEAATRGTLVHSVLERLFDVPAGERTAPAAKSLIPGQWDRLRESRPEVVELFADDPDGERLARWLGEAERLVERWFTLEDPTRLEPAERELFVETRLESGLTLRGIIDRVDVAPTGEVRIVDYKTGKAPRPEYAEGALFQMKFYALVVWRLKNVIPRRLQLVYLGSGDVLTYDPVLADLERVERKLLALWEAIRLATETGDWRPRPTKLCGWCDHQEHCPEFGGTPPPYPLPVKSATGEQGRMGPG